VSRLLCRQCELVWDDVSTEALMFEPVPLAVGPPRHCAACQCSEQDLEQHVGVGRVGPGGELARDPESGVREI
jgi:hypothetical protein